jgi:hypothetical protein
MSDFTGAWILSTDFRKISGHTGNPHNTLPTAVRINNGLLYNVSVKCVFLKAMCVINIIVTG